MKKDDFSVLLDKKESKEVRGASTGGSALKGKSIFRDNDTGIVDSIETVSKEGLRLVPPYMVISARNFCNEEEGSWLEWYATNAEQVVAFDEQGIIGEKETKYVIDIHNGGLFVHNPKAIRKAIVEDKLTDNTFQLKQQTIDNLLDAIKNKDNTALKQIVHGKNVTYSGDYKGFLEASAEQDFIKGMDTSFVIVRPLEETFDFYQRNDYIANQKKNPELIIAAGGKARLAKMLDKAESFGYNKFQSRLAGQKHKNPNHGNNTGRIVLLGPHNYGLYGFIKGNGYALGVAPEALIVFYNNLKK